MISNLLANAVTHGALGAPIHVGAGVTEGFFSLSVTNSGKKISDDLFPNPFLPFERRKAPPSREGLGLGLFIASEIAKGHGGTLDASSDNNRTALTFQMPIREATTA